MQNKFIEVSSLLMSIRLAPNAQVSKIRQQLVKSSYVWKCWSLVKSMERGNEAALPKKHTMHSKKKEDAGTKVCMGKLSVISTSRFSCRIPTELYRSNGLLPAQGFA